MPRPEEEEEEAEEAREEESPLPLLPLLPLDGAEPMVSGGGGGGAVNCVCALGAVAVLHRLLVQWIARRVHASGDECRRMRLLLLGRVQQG